MATNSAERIAIANERTKLSATFLNGIAIAVISIGVLAPIASMAFRAAAVPPEGRSLLYSAAAGAIGIACHFAGRLLLGGGPMMAILSDPWFPAFAALGMVGVIAVVLVAIHPWLLRHKPVACTLLRDRRGVLSRRLAACGGGR